MKNFEPGKLDRRLEERMELIVVLGRRRDQILFSPVVDLKALEQLVRDYEAARMPCAAAELRKRLEWYRTSFIKASNEKSCSLGKTHPKTKQLAQYGRDRIMHFGRQCLGGRIPDQKALNTEAQAQAKERNDEVVR
jgi:hypothetical protein